MSENEIGLREGRAQFGDLVSRAEYAGQITYITRHGRRVAAIVPISLIPQEPEMSSATTFDTFTLISAVTGDIMPEGAMEVGAPDSPVTWDGLPVSAQEWATAQGYGDDPDELLYALPGATVLDGYPALVVDSEGIAFPDGYQVTEESNRRTTAILLRAADLIADSDPADTSGQRVLDAINAAGNELYPGGWPVRFIDESGRTGVLTLDVEGHLQTYLESSLDEQALADLEGLRGDAFVCAWGAGRLSDEIAETLRASTAE